MARQLVSPDSVIEPCTNLLNEPALTSAQRAEALLVRGRAFHRTKRLEQAAADYEAAAALAPDNAEIWMFWANIEVRRRDGRSYMAKVQRAASVDPNNPRVLRAIGVMFDNFGDRDKAMAFYGKALAADPHEPFALLFRSKIYQSERRYADAIADADALVALPRDAINLDGGYLDEEGDVRDFHAVALIYRGRLFQETRQNDRAAQDFDAAVAEGHSTPALVAKAEFLLSQSNASPEAIAFLEDATTREPGNAPAQLSLGMAYVRSQKFELAFTAFDKAIAAKPDLSPALMMRARMHRQFGRTDEAVADFIAAIGTNPSALKRQMLTLRHAGYWTSAKDPDRLTSDVMDAIRACMIDTTCN
ncbi:tetratricopeptide repeat protein [Microbacteriaceae bacterium K1510]|nr:tetratricopeptide repeat protein [Microbacteriaceae bacterium K1510]